MEYFDAHCHVQFDAYDADRAEVLQRMRDAEVGGLIVGCDLTSSKAAVELVRAESEGATSALGGRTLELFSAVGLHPNHAADEPFDMTTYELLLQDPKNRIVAIGECGLDYYRLQAEGASSALGGRTLKIQQEVLEQHVELAVKYGKPLMIHSRPSKGTQDAYNDTIALLTSKKREYGDRLKGDMHFFVGGVEEARQFVELDFTMSYTAVLTFARDYDEVVRSIPLTHILSETDSPYVAPAPNRGKRNEPTAVRDVVRAIAGIRGEDEEVVREAILGNSGKLFGFPT